MLSIRLENDDDGDNDRQHESSRTYSDGLVLGSSCESSWGDERSTPDIEKLIDNDLREMGLEIQDFGKLEPCL